MEKHYLLNDQEFENKFNDCTLEPALFSHEAHIRLVWIHINKYGLKAACYNICKQIKLFDIIHDKGEKFNKTITIASVMVVHHFTQKSKAINFCEFIQEFSRLNTHFIELIHFHYGFDLFNSEKAKTEYLEPDLLPFE